jgi:uncharacterized membrane protein
MDPSKESAIPVEMERGLRGRLRRRLRSGLGWGRVYRASSYLKSALWTVPFIAIALDLTLTPALHALDTWLQWRPRGLQPAGATALYETVVTLALSFLVFTFGSLLVAIQVAGGQLTSRIIATVLLRDNVVRYSVGLFVFTLVFAVGALNRLEAQVHELVALITALIGIACIADFLFLIDYAARLLRPVNVLAAVAERGIRVIEDVYPLGAPLAPAAPGAASAKDSRILQLRGEGAGSRTVTHEGTSSILLAADVDSLVALAKKYDGLVEVVPQVGDFVAVDDPLFLLRGGAVAIDARQLLAVVAFGPERTMEHDPMFAFRIIVDIGLKALSPAINDPTTAVLAIDQLHRLLRFVARHRLRGDVVFDPEGVARVVFRTPNWEQFVQLACSEIRACGANNVQVMRRMRAMLQNLSASLPEYRREALAIQLELLDWAVRTNFSRPEELALASMPDSQGLGGSSSDAELSERAE